jgi:hypothetical protein
LALALALALALPVVFPDPVLASERFLEESSSPEFELFMVHLALRASLSSGPPDTHNHAKGE